MWRSLYSWPPRLRNKTLISSLYVPSWLQYLSFPEPRVFPLIFTICVCISMNIRFASFWTLYKWNYNLSIPVRLLSFNIFWRFIHVWLYFINFHFSIGAPVYEQTVMSLSVLLLMSILFVSSFFCFLFFFDSDK